MQFVFLRILIKRIKAIKFFMKDKTVPFRKKLLVGFGIFYLLWPLDIIPTPILLFGIVDDIVLWVFILWYLKDELDNYWLGDDTQRAEKKYYGKNIINDVKFEVEQDQDSKEGE
ncbi:MAG: YkvA family protein [Anaerovoracaceae bacterium]|jgi:uncharacterized membrane protein YkvA (DUF1232 family)